jgi:hypothetical protein
MQNATKVTATLQMSPRARLPATSVEADLQLKRWTGTVGGILVTVLGMTSVVAAVLAAMAFSQLTAVKADVSVAREELMLAQEHATRLERQLDKAVHDFDQRLAKAAEQAQINAVQNNAAQANAAKETRAERPSFQLTQDEVQLIRSYIKASPVTSEVGATISAGEELRDVTMLPLPSQIATKSPRLAGGRFKIDRNGAIIISLRKSRLADVVIQPN